MLARFDDWLQRGNIKEFSRHLRNASFSYRTIRVLLIVLFTTVPHVRRVETLCSCLPTRERPGLAGRRTGDQRKRHCSVRDERGCSERPNGGSGRRRKARSPGVLWIRGERTNRRYIGRALLAGLFEFVLEFGIAPHIIQGCTKPIAESKVLARRLSLVIVRRRRRRVFILACPRTRRRTRWKTLENERRTCTHCHTPVIILDGSQQLHEYRYEGRPSVQRHASSLRHRYGCVFKIYR